MPLKVFLPCFLVLGSIIFITKRMSNVQVRNTKAFLRLVWRTLTDISFVACLNVDPDLRERAIYRYERTVYMSVFLNLLPC